MVTRDQNPELNLRTFSNVGPSWPDVHKVRLTTKTRIVTQNFKMLPGKEMLIRVVI